MSLPLYGFPKADVIIAPINRLSESPHFHAQPLLLGRLTGLFSRLGFGVIVRNLPSKSGSFVTIAHIARAICWLIATATI